MSKALRLPAASGRQSCSIASFKLGLPGSGTASGGTARRQGAAATVASTQQRADSADPGATLRPRPIPRPQQVPIRGAPEGVGTSVTSRWTHVQINNDLARAQSLEELFQVVHAGHHLFNEVNAVTALHRIARVRLPQTSIRDMCRQP